MVEGVKNECAFNSKEPKISFASVFYAWQGEGRYALIQMLQRKVLKAKTAD